MKVGKFNICACVALGTLNLSAQGFEQRINQRIATGIRIHGHPFEGPSRPPEALMKALEGKRLVGLGEATHGTSEIQVLFSTLILAMARRHQVLVFLEDRFASVAPIARYTGGEGVEEDLPRLMHGLLSVHQTQEYADFFRSVRRFNSAVESARRVQIYGVDNYLSPGASDPCPSLRNFLNTQGINFAAELERCSLYLDDEETQNSTTAMTFTGDSAKIQLAVSKVNPTVQGQPEAAVMSNSLVRYIQQDVLRYGPFGKVVVNDLEDGPTNTLANGIRDGGMAENIKVLMDAKMGANGIAVWWAHNSHVGRISQLDGDPIGHPGAWGNTGSMLSTWLGRAYTAIATEVGLGSFRGRVLGADGRMGPFEVVPVPTNRPNTLNAIATGVFPRKPVFFSTAAIPLLVQTRQAFKISAVFEVRHPEHAIVHAVPGMAYEGIVSFPASRASKNFTPVQ